MYESVLGADRENELRKQRINLREKENIKREITQTQTQNGLGTHNKRNIGGDTHCTEFAFSDRGFR